MYHAPVVAFVTPMIPLTEPLADVQSEQVSPVEANPTYAKVCETVDRLSLKERLYDGEPPLRRV